MIKLGADLDSYDTKNRKPLDLAVLRNNTIMVDIFNENINIFACSSKIAL